MFDRKLRRTRSLDRWLARACGVSLLLASVATPLAHGSAAAAGPDAPDGARLVMADFDGDGLRDVAEAGAGAVTVRLGRGDASFAEPVTVARAAARGLVAADFTTDGVADLVAYSEREVWLVSAGRDGAFRPARRTAATAPIRSVAVADFDRNGGPDLAAATGRAEVLLLLNRDDRGGFEPRAAAAPEPLVSLAAIRLDADARVDLVAVTASGAVLALRNVGGSFQSVARRDAGFRADMLATAQLDGSGPHDVVAASRRGAVAVMLGVDGAISAPVASHVGADLDRLEIGFVDGDARPDLVASSAGSVVYAPGGADLRFATAAPVPGAEGGPFALARSDGRLATDVLISRPSGVSSHTLEVAPKGGGDLVVTRTDDDLVSPVPGMLRYAVNFANANAGANTVTFQLAAGAPNVEYDANRLVFTIRLQGPISITDAQTSVLGESQTESNPNGPEVVVTSAGGATNGFVVEASATGSRVSGLILNGLDSAMVLRGSGASVLRNYIGANERGDGTPGAASSAPRNVTGVLVEGDDNTIGGADPASSNVISGNSDGVRLADTAEGNTIANNVIGTDGRLGGTSGSGLNLRGVLVAGAAGTTIADNVISGNGGGGPSAGVLVNGGVATTLARNFVGTDRDGAAVLGNVDGGVVLNAAADTTVGPSNAVSNNGGGINYGGIALRGTTTATTGTLVSDNSIAANNERGVFVELGSENQIGPNNVITGSTGDGVAVAAGVGNVITANSITANGGLGIDLVGPNDDAGGVTPNDADDADSGPNGLINFPVIDSAAIAGETQVSVSGTAPEGATVEVFRSDDGDPNGEGVEFLAATVAGAGGAFTVTVSFASGVPEEFSLTATATDGGDGGEGTSEFGPNFTLNQRVEVTPASLDFGSLALGSSLSRTVQICNRGVADLTVGSVSVDGGPFSVSAVDPEGQVLSNDECTTVTVTFAPTSEGPATGSLVIATDDPSRPQVVVPLSGNSVRAEITLNVGEVVFPSTRVGGESTATVVVTNSSPVAVGVGRVDFLRASTRKVSFEDPTDPFFFASPSSFIIPPNGSVNLTIFFRPEMAIRTRDLKKPFLLPTPAYQTPRTVRSEIRLVVSEELGLVESAPIRAKVNPVPEVNLRANDSGIDGDVMTLRIDAFDPDNNVTNAEVVLYNEALEVVARVPSTPGITKRLKKFANGMTVPMTLTYTGLEDFTPAVKYLELTLVDFDGNRSKTVAAEIVYTNTKRGGVRASIVNPRQATLERAPRDR